MNNKTYPALLLLALGLALPASLLAADLPPALQAALLTKILGQSKTITAKGAITVGFYCPSGGSCKTVAGELTKLKDSGAKIGAAAFSVQTIADLSGLGGVDALYVGGSFDAALAATQKHKLLSVTGEDADRNVQAGVSIGLALDSDKPKILANTSSLAKEGVEFPAQFLALTKMYK